MTVLVSYALVGGTQQLYDDLVGLLEPQLRRRPGFVAHAAGSSPDAFHVVEIWTSEEAGQAWYQEQIAPLLADGVVTSVSIRPVSSLILAD